MKKHFKKMMALALAMVMILGTMTISAFAAAPTNGSITVNSPVVGATYKIYKVFDMTTNEAVDAFSYTINENNPFYGAVVAYATDTGEGTEPINGLTLTRISGSNPATYNVSVDKDAFNAQKFGKAMQTALTAGSPAVPANDDKGIVAKDAVAATTVDAPVATQKCTITSDDTSDFIKFDNLALGYFLINPTYPAASYGTVTMGTGNDAQSFTVDDLAKEDDEIADPLALTSDADGRIETYVKSQIGASWDSTEFAAYLTDKGITTNKDGTPLNDQGKKDYYDELFGEMKDDAVAKVLAAFANKLDGSEADINVKPEPTMVFLDSSQPNAVINEKNEIDKWDVPVNPEGDVQPGTPDHGEPSGGKNIVVQENPAYYADWSEAAIGDSVHYQLRVNAMNFINTGNTDATIKQVKEYFLADYQSAHMHFDESKGLHVSIWQGDNANDSQAADPNKKNVTKDATGATVAAGYLDYTSKASTFFKNPENSTADGNFGKNDDIFGDGTGIMVPWVKISEKNPTAPDPNFPIYTTTKVPTGEDYKPTVAEVNEGKYVVDDEGYALDKDNQRIPVYDTYYVYSLYNSDVTIVVDYWMILDDDAIVDEPGNKNFAQYGWSPVDTDEGTGVPKTPDDKDKPSQKEEVDEATVYTFALAWVKTDEKGNQLAGAKFQLPFYVKEAKDGDSYVYAGENPADKTGLTNELTTTATDAVITIKGVKQGTYSITETEAPEGYNKLIAPFDVEAKKSGNGVTTKTKTTIYLDEKGNVVKTETSTTKEYNTDGDSYNNENTTITGEEKSVPVYQFDPIVNQKGTELPSTGGIGTTIFYVIGAILVLGAGILLVTRRRMNAN